uniref:Uncharacterized protein n=1 Tax=Amazona collaria TaxID=241587 RepID=A0A8B9FDG0_9PSIT
MYGCCSLGAHAAKLGDATSGWQCHPSVTCSLGPQIKRFLKEDSEEAELSQLLQDCPPVDSPRNVEPPESWQEPGHPLCGVGRLPPDVDKRDARIFSRSQPLDIQQHIAAPAPPSPNRPRSPWGQLDPYDSSEVQDASVGRGGQRAAGLTAENILALHSQRVRAGMASSRVAPTLGDPLGGQEEGVSCWGGAEG